MTLSTEVIVALIVSGLALLGSVVAGLIVFFGSRSTVKQTDIQSLRNIIEELRTQIASLDETAISQDRRIQELEDQNGDLENWIERLCCQVRELGAEPVAFIRHKWVNANDVRGERKTQPLNKRSIPRTGGNDEPSPKE